jgi:RHS repeat-associated protein
MDKDFINRSLSSYDWQTRFHGETRDDETGFYNYGYRYYDPTTGRWPSRDPLGDEAFFQKYTELSSLELFSTLDNVRKSNLYSFVDNNGINGLDKYGLHGFPAVDCDGTASTATCCSWTAVVGADASNNFTIGALTAHRLTGGPAAEVVWTDPCNIAANAGHTIERISVSKRPNEVIDTGYTMNGVFIKTGTKTIQRAGGERIIGNDGLMFVFTRWALTHSGAQAQAASSATFCCCHAITHP